MRSILASIFRCLVTIERPTKIDPPTSPMSLETTILPHLSRLDHPVGDLLHPPHLRMLLILLALFKRLVPSCEAFWQANLNGS